MTVLDRLRACPPGLVMTPTPTAMMPLLGPLVAGDPVRAPVILIRGFTDFARWATHGPERDVVDPGEKNRSTTW